MFTTFIVYTCVSMYAYVLQPYNCYPLLANIVFEYQRLLYYYNTCARNEQILQRELR